MKWDEQRDLLLAKAADDHKAMEILAAAPGAADSTIGFHAQQAVEKCLKAILCHLHVRYHRTHDLAALLDAIADAGQDVPPEINECRRLQPYAVWLRYDQIPVGNSPGMGREGIKQHVAVVQQWARGIIFGTGPQPRGGDGSNARS